MDVRNASPHVFVSATSTCIPMTSSTGYHLPYQCLCLYPGSRWREGLLSNGGGGLEQDQCITVDSLLLLPYPSAILFTRPRNMRVLEGIGIVEEGGVITNA